MAATAIRRPVHPDAGRSSASVGHTAAQGMSAHMMHAVISGCSTGVPAANPASGGSNEIA
jgi:hypothetical protein